MAISREEFSALGARADALFHWVPRIPSVHLNDANKRTKHHTAAKVPSKLALDWFFDLHDHPLRRTSVRDRLLGYTPEQGKKARQELEEWRLVERYTLHTGKRGGQLAMLVITEAGYELLAGMGVTPKRMRGRGSPLHRLWQNIVAEWLTQRYPEGVVKVEDAGAGKRVDVSLIMPRPPDGATTVAYEVHVSGDAEDALVQALKDLKAEYAEVVICVEKTEMTDKVRALLWQEQAGGLLSQVSFAVLTQFLE